MKTVNIRVKWAAAHPGQDRSALGCGDTLKKRPALDLGWGIVLEDGSGVAIDWVTGRSYSSARRRLNVQSGLRQGEVRAAAPQLERCVP